MTHLTRSCIVLTGPASVSIGRYMLTKEDGITASTPEMKATLRMYSAKLVEAPELGHPGML